MAGMAYTPLQNGERSPYGGGGGKMRARRAPKRNGTPYDRPATGRHASAGPQAAALMNTANGGEAAKRDGWLGSRLLGTASKIVTTGASYLYSSFFKRPAGGGMLLLQDAEKPAGDNTEGATDMLSPSAAEAESREGGSQHGEEDKTSEVESWMKRTFPREEAEKLIASLRSYVKENGTAEEQVDHVNNEGQRRPPIMTTAPALESAPSNGQLTDAQRWREERTKARQEQKSNLWPGGSGKENGTPTGAGTSEVGEVVAVDVARAYMGERVTRVVTPARVTLTREKVNATTPLRLSPYQPSPYLLRKQQATSISTQYESASVPPGGARDCDGVFDENLRTPPLNRTVGRLLPVARTNAPSPAIGYPFSGEGSKKRGSAALEDGAYASGGPIRRLRPRSSLYTPSPASGLQRRGGLGIYPPQPRILQTPIDVKQKSISTWSRNVDVEKEDTKASALGTHASVPERASATARKILETLDMMTPSPKEKSLDTELALVRERPPTELTTSMMNDKARQTMQNWEFSGPPESEEAGPSGRGRNLESDLSAAGFPWKGAEQGTKARGKGKAPATTSTLNTEEKSTDQPSFSFHDTTRSKVSESNLASPSPAVGKNQGFQINADVDDSDEENRGVHSNLLTTSVSSTISFTAKSTMSGSGLFDNNQSRPLNITAPMFGAPIAVESQRTVSEAIDGKSSAAPGGFTFPASNPFGTSLEAPPTPKPFPSPSNTGPPAKSNGVPAYKFNTGSSGDNMFKLPVSHNADDASKVNHQRDSTSGFTPSGVSAPETSKAVSTNSAEAAKIEVSSASGPFGSEISTSPLTTTAFTSSTFSLSNFGAPGAGAKPVFAGVLNQNSQTTSSTPESLSAQATTPVSKNETGFFNFGKSPSLEPAAVTPASTGAGSMFGSSTLTSSAPNSASPSPAFGSSPGFGMTSAGFPFGSSASSSAAAPVLSTAPSATSDDASRPQKRMFGHEQTKTDDTKVAPATVSFGLSAAETTLVTASSSASTFSTTVFGQGAGSSAPAFFSASLPGSKPASDSTPENSSTPPSSSGTSTFGLFGSSAPSSSPGTSTFGLLGSSTSSSSPGTSTFGLLGSSTSSPSPGTSAFGSFGSSSPLFGSSMFGSSNAAPALGGASAASGASSTPSFGGAFGASNTPAFGASSTPAFGASSTPAFGASSTPAFGASSTPAFGTSSTSAFGASSSPAFGASSTSAFGASSTSAFGASSTSAFGASSTSAFGASSTPVFGASSTTAFGASSTPGFGASTQSSQSPSVFGGFGAATNTGSSSSPTTYSFGGGAGSSPFAFGGSSTASPTTSTGAFAFGASSAASPASPFNFGAKPASAPMFDAGRTTPTFGSSPNGGMGGNDMEDTMADDGQMMASSPPPQQQTQLFGASQTSGSGTTFNFGNPATPVTTPSPVFGGFGAPAAPAPANPFGASSQPTPGANPFGASAQQPSPVGNPFGGSPQPGQPLQFGGGGFAVGATGQDAGPKTTRKFIKAKRAGNIKRKS